MKYWVVSFILFFCTLQTFGQEEYFVYLQTENNQPFYVRIDKAVYSSSATGYLILPRINSNSGIPITIGFPKNVFPEQLFSLPATGKDAGYLVKDYGEKGWGLLNLQTQATLMNNNPPDIKKNTELSGTKKTDDFSLLLSHAVNDTAVLYAVVKPPKPVVSPEVKKDSALVATAGNNIIAKDSIATKDTSFIVSNIQLGVVKESSKPKPDTANKVTMDTAAVAKTVAPVSKKQNTDAKDSSLIVSNITLQGVKEDTKPLADSVAKKPITDTAVIVKTAPTVAQPQNTVAKDSPIVKTKQPVKQGRGDSITIINGKNTDTVAKNKERKDTIIMISGGKPAVTDLAKGKEKKDSVVTTKSKAVDDNKAIVKNNNATKDNKIIPAAPQKDSVVEKTEKAELEKPKTAVADLPTKKMPVHISKAAEFRTDTSYVAIFIDEADDDNADTIRISVPFREPEEVVVKKEDSKPANAANKPTDSAVNNKGTKDSTAIAKTVIDNAKQNTAPVPQPIAPVKKDSTVAIANNTTKPGKPVMANSDCKDEATDSDIDKLRVKMLLVTTDEDHIALARRLFKLKCFSVKQVRALTELFKTDEGRYKWFDAVYPYVSDSGNFSSLSEFLKNDYYLNRFKAMLRN
ncbi:MAG: DUF4476 domain-containing protein [Chitinophagaceae bacterium]